MYFDARAAKLLEPGQHLLVEDCPGLRLEASASRKAWTYRYKSLVDGRMKQVGLGLWPAMPVQEAVGKWREKVEQRAAGVDPVVAKREAKAARQDAAGGNAGPLTVRRVVQAYIDGPLKDGRKPAGHEAARRALIRVLDEDVGFAGAVAAELTRAQAFKVLDDRKATPTAAAKLRSMFGSAWEHAQDSGAMPEAPNWWREVMRGKLRSKGKVIGGKNVGRQRRVLPAPEIAALLAWLPNMHALAADAVVMYLWTVTRGAEIFSVRPDHFRLEGEVLWWTIPKANTKNARFDHAVDLRVPLFGRALEVVKRRLDCVGESGWLFEDARGEQYTQHDFSTYIYDLQPYSIKSQARPSRAVLPVSGWTPHQLRKSARTLLAQLGCPNEVGEAILGHMQPEIVGTYNAYTYDAERLHWLAKLSDYLEELVQS